MLILDSKSFRALEICVNRLNRSVTLTPAGMFKVSYEKHMTGREFTYWVQREVLKLGPIDAVIPVSAE